MTFMMIAMIVMMEMTKIYEVNGHDEVRFMNMMRRRWALKKGSGFL